MKGQITLKSKDAEKSESSDLLYLILPLLLAVAVSFLLALMPVATLMFFALIFVVGLIIASTPHHH